MIRENTNINEDKALEVWKSILLAALKIPGASIDRKKYLRNELSKYYRDEKVNRAIDLSPYEADIEPQIIERIAVSSINYHTTQATALSALAGLPGGWWTAGTIPADLTQFFYNVIQLVQKLAYIYGWKDFSSSDDINDEMLLPTLSAKELPKLHDRLQMC